MHITISMTVEHGHDIKQAMSTLVDILTETGKISHIDKQVDGDKLVSCSMKVRDKRVLDMIYALSGNGCFKVSM
ncbi:MAG: hypothetical protein NC548_10820 [Lachnospiraceae bacterium]|nr:hypothetical protein [Lachnospiraceae bacterium]